MVERIIKQIAEDNRSGAAEILIRASQAVSLLEALETDDVDSARRAVIETCAALTRAQPYMASVVNLASAVVRAALLLTSAREVVRAAAAQARAFSDNASRACAAAASHAADLIGEGATVLTHSRSSTVLAALKNAKASGKYFCVIATESRPMLEGRAMAESLARASIGVSLIADAAASAALEKADCVLIGADKVTPEDLINKMGTRMIALAARERNIPAWSICDTSKFTAIRSSVLADQRSADELWPAAPQGVEVLNRYFEPTPLDYFTAIITEEGNFRPDEARLRAQRMVIDQALLDAVDKESP